MLKSSIRTNSLILATFALVTAAMLAGTYDGTRDKIAEAERRAAQKALLEIIPKSRHNNDLLNDVIAITASEQAALGLKGPDDIHVARQNGKPIAVIVPAVAPDGYSGDIKMIVGVNEDGTVAGVRVLSHTETPGLGDKVDLKKSPWLLSFDNKKLGNPAPDHWKVKKDGGHFDQFTGATITPRAVVKQVKQVLLFVERQHALLFAGATTPAAPVESNTHE